MRRGARSPTLNSAVPMRQHCAAGGRNPVFVGEKTGGDLLTIGYELAADRHRITHACILILLFLLLVALVTRILRILRHRGRSCDGGAQQGQRQYCAKFHGSLLQLYIAPSAGAIRPSRGPEKSGRIM